MGVEHVQAGFMVGVRQLEDAPLALACMTVSTLRSVGVELGAGVVVVEEIRMECGAN